MIRKPLIIGHRGASSHAPENTLAAFRMALDAGADGLEFDVQLSADGVPVVIHDHSLVRTAARPEKVGDLTAEELKAVDVGSWFNERFPDRANAEFALETIPTLEDVLSLMSGREGLIYIELKADEGDHRLLAKAVCDVIRDSPLLPQMIVKSFRLAVIPEVRFHLPEVTTAALFEPRVKHYLRKKRYVIDVARAFGADQISLHRSLATGRMADRAQEAGMPVTIWTADDPRWIGRAVKRGIRAVITNDPATLLRVRDGE